MFCPHFLHHRKYHHLFLRWFLLIIQHYSVKSKRQHVTQFFSVVTTILRQLTPIWLIVVSIHLVHILFLHLSLHPYHQQHHVLLTWFKHKQAMLSWYHIHKVKSIDQIFFFVYQHVFDCFEYMYVRHGVDPDVCICKTKRQRGKGSELY